MVNMPFVKMNGKDTIAGVTYRDNITNRSDERVNVLCIVSIKLSDVQKC